MRRFLSAALALVLAFSLSLPALAWGEPSDKYASFDQYLDFYRAQDNPETQSLVRFLDAYLDAHPDEVASFDPHAYFEANIASGAGMNIANWFFDQLPDYTEDHFRAEMTDTWLTGLYRDELNALTDTDPPMWRLCLSPSAVAGEEISLERCLAYTAMTEEQYAAMAKWCARFQFERPGEWAAFDPDAYYLSNSQNAEVPDKMAWSGEQGFEDYTRYGWMRTMYLAWEKDRAAREMARRYPEDYAAFDPDAWFSARAGELTRFQGGGKEDYMEARGLTTGEEFRLAMFADWLTLSVSQPMGVTVTVNGVPILAWLDFSPAYPYAEQGRIMVSTPALAESLGFSVERDEENRVLICTKGDCSVTFTDGESAYLVTRDGKGEVLALDVPTKSHGPGAPCYVPLRALVEALGFNVEWKGPFRTAAVTTPREER